MSYMLPCNCPPPATECSLEEVIKRTLEASSVFTNVAIFTGSLATLADTQNIGAKLPFAVISDLGPNNSRRVGESIVQHEITVRFLYYTVTDRDGLRLARVASAALADAGVLETADGYVCQSRIVARARPLKLSSDRWSIQVNQTFIVRTYL
jgi:hypothetical protein